MKRLWLFDKLAVSVAQVDFLDPALCKQPDVRERGVRVEVRRARARDTGSIYASSALSIDPAIFRVDLLESAPGAADRMHWHPGMRDGEPGDRTLDPTLSEDPGLWLSAFFARLGDAIRTYDVATPDDISCDLTPIAGAADEIVVQAMQSLARMRQPWPHVQHDRRGLARA